MTAIGESLKVQKLLVWLRWPDCLWIAPVGEGAGGYRLPHLIGMAFY